MASITNVIKTIFTSSGAQDVTQDADRASRSVTRLGQASAGAGRQFSAQAQGLGGLVAAYAGAAATSFALQAAFTALASSARSLQTIEGLTTLAATSGAAGQSILASVQTITKGQLSLVESAQQINLALSAGFNTEQIEGLSGVALKASRALGRDLSDAMTRVTRGSAKMETELLDELGIYTKIEPATRAYATSIGKAVSQLTEYERRQAFVNAVIAEGQRKFSSINTTIPTAAEKIEAFGKRIVDLGTAFGAFIAERLAPLADFFTNNLAASIGAFGTLGSLILGKALSEIGQKITNFKSYVETQSAVINQRILKLTKASAAQVTAAQTSVAGISLAPKGTAGIKDELKSLKEIAAQRALTTQELTKAQTVLQRRITNLQALRTAEIQQVVAARQARSAATAGSAAYVAAQQAIATLGTKLRTTNSLLAATTTQLNTVTVAANSNNAAMAKFFSAVVLRGGMAVAAVARLSVAMVSLGGFILSAASIIGILGSAIANAVGKGDEFNAWVKGLGDIIKNIFDPQIAKDTRNVFQGISAGALSSIESANQKIRELDTFKFRQKKVLGVTIQVEKTKEDLVKEVSKLLSDISLDDGIDVAEAASTGTFWGSVVGGAFAGGLAGSAFAGIGAIIGALGGAIAGGVISIFAQVGDESVKVSEKSLNTVQQLYGTELAAIASDPNLGAGVATTAEKALAYLEDQYGAAAKLDPVAKAYLDTQRQIVLESVKYQASVNEIAAIIAATGKSADQIVKTFDSGKLIQGLASADIGTSSVELVLINKDKIQAELEEIYTYTTQPIDLAVVASGINITDQEINALIDKIKNSGKPVRESISDLVQTERGASLAYLLEISKLSDAEIGALGTIAQSGTINIGESFSEAITAGEDLNGVLLRTTDLFITVQEGIRSGTIDLERFSQSTGNIGTALVAARRELPIFDELITAAKTAQAEAAKFGMDVTPYVDILTQLEAQKVAIEATLAKSEEELSILKQKEDSLRNQIQLTKFIADITPKDVNPFGLELNIFKAAASSKGEELAITIDYLSQIVRETDAATQTFKAYEATVTRSRVDENIQALLLSSTEEGAQKTVDAINKITGANATLNNGVITVTDSLTGVAQAVRPVTQEVYNLANTSKSASEAIAKLGAEALLQATSYMKDAIQEYSKLRTDIDQQLLDIAAETRTAQIKFEADLSQVYRDIDILKQEAAIAQLELDIDLAKARVDAGDLSKVEGAKQENQIRQQLLQEQEALIYLQMGNEAMALAARFDLLEQENANSIADIERQAQQQREKIAADLAYIDALVSVYETSISQQQSTNQALVSGFAQAGNNFNSTLANIFTQAASAIGTAIQTMGASTPGVVAVNSSAPILAQTEEAFGTIRDSFVGAAGEALASIDVQETALLSQQEQRYENSRDLLIAEGELIAANYEAKIAGLQKEGEIEKYNAMAREKDAAKGGKEKLTELQKKLTELFDSIKGNIESALMSLNDLIFYGEGNFGDIMSNLFKSIQQDIFKTTIADPLSNTITEGLFSFLGVSGGKKGIENAKVGADGALLVRMVTGPEEAFKGLFNKDKTKDPTGETKGIFGGLIDQVTSMFSNVFGQGGIISRLFSGLFGQGGILSGIFKGILGIFGFGGMAQGGMVHLAQGGAAASASLRDRVPAMLEPGEFVLRKHSARKIGMPALQAMNATGNAGGSGNVVVNMTNEGAPKQAEASAPRFDGEKYVVDVIMRDLANNGPIRRSLRGRGGL